MQSLVVSRVQQHESFPGFDLAGFCDQAAAFLGVIVLARQALANNRQAIGRGQQDELVPIERVERCPEIGIVAFWKILADPHALHEPARQPRACKFGRGNLRESLAFELF
ncbi:hypothetical protein, partial [Mesorhizobium sp. M4B.F.Ca.ET.013.02.1.1]|uniref:hypothetical protein n=1 Tax=Mesorhizobium sp. M4B.F.Ca.ET.013.02.1.1 TaxID=2496755 RepID=UPI001AECA3FD